MPDTPTTFDVALHDLSSLSAHEIAELHQRTESDMTPFLKAVQPIIEDVKTNGDDALVRYAQKFDGATISTKDIAVTRQDIDLAFDKLDKKLIETLEFAADNILRFHKAQMPPQMWNMQIQPGAWVGERTTPIESAALYSPRGKGCFPSVTLMTTIPAVVAGVKQPIILTPAGPGGTVDAGTLVAARLAGVEHVFKAGGAVAVAAAAYGTQTVPKCLVMEGPGSPWVVAAKQLLSNQIASHVKAGPTESMTLADETADPKKVALDILIEAEHGADSSVFLVTPDQSLANQVKANLPHFLAHMSAQRAQFAQSVLSGTNGGIVLTQTLQQAYDFVNQYAPEHLQIMSQHPFEHLEHIHNASEILLGEEAPSSIANYVLGPNAVLPTSGAAKYGAPLGVHHFLKSASVAHITKAGFENLAQHTHRFATYEGFDAHANAVSDLRFSS